MDIEQLFLYYYRPLCLYALRFLGDIDKAEDLVQDCFVRLLEQEGYSSSSSAEDYNSSAGGYNSLAEGYSSKAPLLFRIVRNRCIDDLRRNRHMVPTLSLDQFAEHAGPGSTPRPQEDIPTDDIDDAFEAARLWTAIDSLPDRCREAFLLSKRDGMTYHEIAEELGISERTVEHQISKALRILRGKASDFFRFLFLLT